MIVRIVMQHQCLRSSCENEWRHKYKGTYFFFSYGIASARSFRLGYTFFRPDNDPEYTSKSAQKCLQGV